MVESEDALKMLLNQFGGPDDDKSISINQPVAQDPEVLNTLRKRQKNADTSMLYAGAAGALGELLFGGTGKIADAGVSAMQGQMKRRRNLEDQETKYQMMTAKSGMKSTLGGQYQQVPLVNTKTGKRLLARFDKKSGVYTNQQNQPVGPDWAKDYKETISEDPYRGDKFLVSRTGKKTPIFDRPKGALAPKSRDLLETSKKEYNASIKNNDASIQDLNRAISSLGVNALGDKMAIMSIVKSLEGRMTDEDRTYYSEPYGFLARLWRDIEHMEESELPEDITGQARAVLTKMLEASSKYGDHHRNKYADQISKTGLVDRDRAWDELGGSLPISKGQQQEEPLNIDELQELIDLKKLQEGK